MIYSVWELAKGAGYEQNMKTEMVILNMLAPTPWQVRYEDHHILA